MRRISGVLTALLLAGACAQERPASSGKLKSAVEASRVMPPCRAVIALEWPYGWPVPLEAAGQRRFKLFYYPLAGAPPNEPRVFTPAAEAVLDLETGGPVECVSLPAEPVELKGPRWPAALKGLGMSEFDERSDALYDRTEAVADLFSSGRALSAAESAHAREYLRHFESMAEPALLPYYYRLNPGFWEWLRSAAGRSIPKA